MIEGNQLMVRLRESAASRAHRLTFPRVIIVGHRLSERLPGHHRIAGRASLTSPCNGNQNVATLKPVERGNPVSRYPFPLLGNATELVGDCFWAITQPPGTAVIAASLFAVRKSHCLRNCLNRRKRLRALVVAKSLANRRQHKVIAWTAGVQMPGVQDGFACNGMTSAAGWNNQRGRAYAASRLTGTVMRTPKAVRTTVPVKALDRNRRMEILPRMQEVLCRSIFRAAQPYSGQKQSFQEAGN